MENVKRVYAKPTILKVQLRHEQAVLAACSSRAGGAATTGINCNSKSNPECTKSTSSNMADSTGAS